MTNWEAALVRRQEFRKRTVGGVCLWHQPTTLGLGNALGCDDRRVCGPDLGCRRARPMKGALIRVCSSPRTKASSFGRRRVKPVRQPVRSCTGKGGKGDASRTLVESDEVGPTEEKTPQRAISCELQGRGEFFPSGPAPWRGAMSCPGRPVPAAPQRFPGPAKSDHLRTPDWIQHTPCHGGLDRSIPM